MDCSTLVFRIHYQLSDSNSYLLSQWCHPTISSSVVPFSSCLQSFLASGSLLVSQIFSSGGQRIAASASASILPMNSQNWFPLELTALISFKSKGLPRVFSNTTIWTQMPVLKSATQALGHWEAGPWYKWEPRVWKYSWRFRKKFYSMGISLCLPIYPASYMEPSSMVLLLRSFAFSDYLAFCRIREQSWGFS